MYIVRVLPALSHNPVNPHETPQFNSFLGDSRHRGGVPLCSLVIAVSQHPDRGWAQVDVDALLQTKWEGMKAALAARDIPRALGEVAVGVRSRFQTVFQALEADLPTIAPTLGTASITSVSEGLAEGVIQRVQGGKTYLYFVYWAPDPDGIWRIIEM